MMCASVEERRGVRTRSRSGEGVEKCKIRREGSAGRKIEQTSENVVEAMAMAIVWDSLGRADTSERRVAMRAYDLDGDSRSAHKMSAASMMTVNDPSGAAGRGPFRFVFVVMRNDGLLRTLLDAVQNGLGEIGRQCLAVARHLCGPVDNVQSLSRRSSVCVCKCRRRVKEAEEQNVGCRVSVVYECAQDGQAGLNEGGLEHDEWQVRTGQA